LASDSPKLILQHVGSFSATATLDLGAPAQSIQYLTFEISQQGPGPLSFTVGVGPAAGTVTVTKPIPIPSAPTSLTPAGSVTQVGLGAFFEPTTSGTGSSSLDFSSLQLGYGNVEEPPLLPAKPRTQLTLTVKRNFLQPAGSVDNGQPQTLPSSPPVPDYCVAFWLVTSGFSKALFHGSTR
jgi:hypothetical protein